MLKVGEAWQANMAGCGRLWTVTGLVLLLAAVSAGVTACGDKDGKDKASGGGLAALVGTSVKDVVVQDLDGVAQKLDDPFILAPNGQAKPVIVNVWATWCAPCLAEMPQLAALGDPKQGGGKYTVLAINTDKDTQTVKEFLKKQTWGPGVTVLFDKLGSVTREKMGARTLPVTLVTTPDLTVKMAVAGERQWASTAMQGQLLQALK